MGRREAEQILKLREEGKTFASIASIFGISIERARQIYLSAKAANENEPSWPPFKRMLSARSRNCLIHHFGTEDILSDPKKIADIGILNLRKIRNIGIKSLREIVLALHSLGYIEFEEITNWFTGMFSGSVAQVKSAPSETGENKPRKPAPILKPHLGEVLLQRYGDRITEGFDDLKNFELIDELKKPILGFIFYGNRRIILEVHQFLSQFPYAFTVRTKKGLDLRALPEQGIRNAHVHISRFPHLIRFVEKHESEMLCDLWGLLYGYPLDEVYQFTYAKKE